jgi:hypothetical protein
MDKNNFNESLVRLAAELKKVDRIDENSRELVEKLDADIHRILGANGEVPPEHRLTLIETLERSVDRLEATHPTLTLLMGRLIKALSDMGI